MARDILNEFGNESNQPSYSPQVRGGVMSGKDVMRYLPPVGPKGIKDPQSPGIHGANSGTDGSQGSTHDALQRGGTVGIVTNGGVNRGNCGSQGRY